LDIVRVDLGYHAFSDETSFLGRDVLTLRDDGDRILPAQPQLSRRPRATYRP
jgi:hypothetical protein